MSDGPREHFGANDTDFYQDDAGAWELMEPTTNQSTGVHLITNYFFNTTILSINQVGQPLRFSVPPYTSLLQWYGTVGPDQGRFALRFFPTSDGEIQFQPHLPDESLNVTGSGLSSVESLHETMHVAWLDPRATYDAEIELLEEGKRTDLHGISFLRYTEV